MEFFRKKKKGPSPEVVKIVKEIAREPEHDMEILAIKKHGQLENEKWDLRRWELVRFLVLQDRKSVVLGKLQASPRTIARKARELADATIAELRTNKPNNDNGRETDNKSL